MFPSFSEQLSVVSICETLGTLTTEKQSTWALGGSVTDCCSCWTRHTLLTSVFWGWWLAVFSGRGLVTAAQALMRLNWGLNWTVFISGGSTGNEYASKLILPVQEFAFFWPCVWRLRLFAGCKPPVPSFSWSSACSAASPACQCFLHVESISPCSVLGQCLRNWTDFSNHFVSLHDADSHRLWIHAWEM